MSRVADFLSRDSEFQNPLKDATICIMNNCKFLSLPSS